MKKLILGSRGSALALAQSRLIIDLFQVAGSKAQFELKIIKTAGDELQNKDIAPLPPGKGIFTREIEEALLRKEIDLAVHSLKDLPTDIRTDLTLAAITERADARDVLISRGPESISQLPKGARIATGSPRRTAQIKWLRNDIVTLDLRGNVDTRIRKFREHNDWDGIILAHAGLQRLKPDVAGLVVTPLPLDEMLPAPGQGALAIQIRADDLETQQVAALANHPSTHAQVTAERAFLAGLGGGCLMPIAACGIVTGDRLKLNGICWLADAPKPKKGSVEGMTQDAEKLGRDLAAQLSA